VESDGGLAFKVERIAYLKTISCDMLEALSRLVGVSTEWLSHSVTKALITKCSFNFADGRLSKP